MVSDQVTWGSTIIPYKYRFSRSKTLAITVQPDLTVVVTAPQGTDLERIRAKVCKRGAWIQKAWREFERFHPLQPAREYVPGECHRYLGRQYRLRAVHGATPRVILGRGVIEIVTPNHATPRVLKPLVQDWYQERAKAVLQERFQACYRLASVERVPMPTLSIRRMANRWGSCTPNGRVVLNSELIKAPKDCIDYVIMHELCHLIEHNHSPIFWRLLGRLMPNWEDRRKRLNDMANG